MTDFEKAKQLFSTCSIFRGGGSPGEQEGTYDVNIAVDDGTGFHKSYLELVFVFDADGNWISTRHATKPRTLRNRKR